MRILPINNSITTIKKTEMINTASRPKKANLLSFNGDSINIGLDPKKIFYMAIPSYYNEKDGKQKNVDFRRARTRRHFGRSGLQFC